MKIKYIIISLCLVILSGFNLNAQDPLTIDQCREMAIENNKQMQTARLTVDKTGYDVKAYRGKYLPQFSLQGGYFLTDNSLKHTIEGGYLPTYLPDASGNLVPDILTIIDGNPIFNRYAYFPDMNLELKINGTYTVGVQATQPIYTGGRLNAGNRMTKTGRQIAILSEKMTRSEVIVKIDEAYWQHILSNEMVSVAQLYKETVFELYNSVDNAFQAGLKSQNDLLKVQVAINEAELNLKRAENAVKITRMNLCHLLGLPLTSSITLAGGLDDVPIEIQQEYTIASRPEYEILQAQIDIKDQEVKYAIGDTYLPTIALSGGYNYANGIKLNGTKLLDKGSFYAMGTISIPLFGKWEGGDKIRSIRTEQKIMMTKRDEVAEMIELEIVQARNAYEESILEVALTGRSLEQAEENLRISRDHYDAGMETLAGYLEAQTSWQKCMSEEVNAKATLRLNETRYLKATGRL